MAEDKTTEETDSTTTEKEQTGNQDRWPPQERFSKSDDKKGTTRKG
ncbi:hypothetical protein [uncultured Desulfovibrio sp.]|nr:hypothetical protein [uncultured Desulfovibrio sp.]